ncbi:hypothetical protein QL285_049124 [Trifolium repens]|nr:hypothetical protein QL285_049124 [Trifolium repens]
MFSINPSMYVGLRNPKKHLITPENAKQHHIYASLRPGALTRARGRALAPAPEATAPWRQQSCAMAPSRGLALPAVCCLLPVEPSPGHTRFLQHHFQGNIQHKYY